MSVLVLNAGSSSLKFSLFDDTATSVELAGIIERGGELPRLTLETGRNVEPSELTATDWPGQLTYLHELIQRHLADARDSVGAVAAVGHRVVHGGEQFRQSTPLDDETIATLQTVARLAPLHNPPAMEVIHAARKTWPEATHTACFDTAFFSGLPPERYLFPVPREWHRDWGIRRYGFHGLSHAYCAHRTAEVLHREIDGLKIVTVHLGSGCSAAASSGGEAVATTMGLTPLDGLMMGTRPGGLDPGVILEAQRRGGLTPDDVDRILNRESGLLGVSGESADFRELERLAAAGHEPATLALTMFENRIAETIASLVVSLDGIDALTFTAGIGENAAGLRARVCRRLRCLGLQLCEERNAADGGDRIISTPDSAACILVVRTREDLVIARDARRISVACRSAKGRPFAD